MNTRTAFFASATLVAALVNAQDLAMVQHARHGASDPGTHVEAAASPIDLSATDRLEKQLDKLVERYVTYPYLDKDPMYGAVVVTYVVDTEGKLKVMRSEGTNQRLVDHVLAKLGRIDVGENPSGLWTKTTARFVFTPER
ncbi:MAG: hypothetical protein ABI599_10435 [Flavobacteriales bacterium]